MADIFLSYNRDDLSTARRFAEAFEREGFSVWWDQTLNPGEHYDHITEKALREAKAVVVLWSKKSVESRWVRAEATLADRNKTLVPVMIESCDRPIMFELTHTADLSQWNGDRNDKTWQAYLAGVRRFVNKDSPAPVPPSASPPPTARPKRLGLAAIAIAVVALLIAGIVLWFVDRASRPTATQEVTLAVLPFADYSAAHDQESFCDGLSEEILNQLAQVKGLTVTARTSSFSYKGKNEDMRKIAKELGVANLLEGSIQKEGNQLRITAQLINGKTGTHLWSKIYPRERKDIFAVQEEIAKDVAQALSITLDVGDTNRAQGGTNNLDAYDKYLRGMAAFAQTDKAQAIQHFREAVALDPAFVEGWWVLFANLGGGGTGYGGDETIKALERLQALAPGSWRALLAQGLQLGDAHQWSRSETAFDAALAAAPPYFSTPVEIYHSVNLRHLGHLREAHEIWQRYIKADPLSLVFSGLHQFDLAAMGRNAEALSELDRSKTLVGHQGGDERELNMALRLHNQADAAAVWAQYSSVTKQDPFLQELFTLRADNAEVRAALQRSFDKSDAAQLGIRIAIWADYFGDRNLALAALRKGLLASKGSATFLLWFPWKTSLRADSKFKGIVRELGLVDYWRSSGKWGDFCSPVGKEDFECH